MSWQPDTKWKREEKPVTIEELLERLRKHEWLALKAFILMLEADDVITEVREGNNNRGTVKIIAKRGNSIGLWLNVSSWMA